MTVDLSRRESVSTETDCHCRSSQSHVFAPASRESFDALVESGKFGAARIT